LAFQIEEHGSQFSGRKNNETRERRGRKTHDSEPGENEVDGVVNSLDHEDEFPRYAMSTPPDPSGVPESVERSEQGSIEPSTSLEDEPSNEERLSARASRGEGKV